KLRGPSPTIKFDVTVSRVRINQVYVIGEVKQPGAYQISALGSALTALYAAGGITARANLRQIEIRRLNNGVATLGPYDSLLPGGPVPCPGPPWTSRSQSPPHRAISAGARIRARQPGPHPRTGIPWAGSAFPLCRWITVTRWWWIPSARSRACCTSVYQGWSP